MKRKILAGLVFAGVLGISGAAFADLNVNINVGEQKYRPIAKAQTNNKRPPEPPKMSKDIRGNDQNRPPEPPDGKMKRPPMSGDKKFDDNKRPPKPRSDDRRPPEFRSDDRRPQSPIKKGSK